MTREQYFDANKWAAIWQGIFYGVPASITLAQGALESGDGNSRLAREANNHFGVKGYSNPYNLPLVYFTDDIANEPFIKYDSVKESYIGHSLFLMDNARYNALFNSLDYKTWAEGLGAAGYATNPTYPKLLIDIIEKYNLQKYDFYAKYKWVILISFLLVILAIIYLLWRLIKRNKK